MEILAALVSAIALGASQGVGSLASQAVTDAYQAVKDYLSARYSSVDVAQLERDPQSSKRRALLEEELSQAGVENDAELLNKINRILTAAAQDNFGQQDGVVLKQLEVAQDVIIERLTTSGRAVVGDSWTIGGGLRISDINNAEGRPPTDVSAPKNG
jgi:hypothetical protein